MAYLIEHRPNGNQMLIELNANDAKLVLSGCHDQARHGVWFEKITAPRAHEWVKSGAVHMTALWVDDGKVRRASDKSE